MIDITNKFKTLRYAKAQAIVKFPEFLYEKIITNDLPKKDPLIFAKAAGMLGVKKTPDLIPHCHPIPIEYFNIDYELNKDHILIIAEAKTIARTGIEMEVLTAVSITALTIYDLLKPVTKELEITEIKLIHKEGGKSDRWKRVREGLSCAVLVCSDTIYKKFKENQPIPEEKSGKLIIDKVKEYGVECKDYKILPDEPEEIKKWILEKLEQKIPFIFITGGTGLGPRDNTVEVLKEIGGKEVPGISEAMRIYGYERTPLAMMSRAISVMKDGCLIISLPGSSKGVEESLQAILPAVFHADRMMRGERH
ncbi:MAG: bifunctional molybdenum cofactor biosynthesis protein MoaC/MoaB [Leptospiraceae bacterium]|nr:MAG: bifunctional molybdenum cofactor biosynthesis protein MoaC/MoaB [Leptospiraceae bacterium]